MSLFKPSVETLIEKLTSANAADERQSAEALLTIRKLAELKNPQSVPALIAALNHKPSFRLVIDEKSKTSSYVEHEAARALSAIGTPEAIDAIMQALLGANFGTAQVITPLLSARKLNDEWMRVNICVDGKGEVVGVKLGSNPNFAPPEFQFSQRPDIVRIQLILCLEERQGNFRGTYDLKVSSHTLIGPEGKRLRLEDLSPGQLEGVWNWMRQRRFAGSYLPTWWELTKHLPSGKENTAPSS